MSNLMLYDTEKLKKQGIDFKLIYRLEFTQSQKVYDEVFNKGIYENLKVLYFDNIDDAVQLFIKFYDDNADIPVLYRQLDLQLKINDIIVLEDVIYSINYTDSTCKALQKLRYNNDMLTNEVSLYDKFLDEYNAKEQFEEFKKEELYSMVQLKSGN